MITLTLILAIALIGTDHLVGAFRDYDDPRTASPPLIVPASRPHDVLIVDNANISNYYQLFTSPFNMGKLIDPVNDIECIVLELEGAVAGVQYDRFGGLFLGGVELLRLTTPEPSRTGIRCGRATSWLSASILHYLIASPVC